MKNSFVTPTRCGAMLALSALSLSAGALLLPAIAPASAPAAQAAPRPKLEIWPGQRVLLVLPLTIGPDWNGGPELAEALKPIMKPILQRELTDTDKFSVTLPYRFDPILRRATAENRISQDIITPFLEDPSLETAQPVFTNLKFEQVPMVTQVQLEELRVGGTPKKPTLQLQASAKLYEVGGSGPFRSIVVTSNPAEGKTPEARLQNAAADAFGQIAEFFVKPPETFQLPASLQVVAEPEMTDADGKMDDTKGMANGKAPIVPAPKPQVSTAAPNAMAPKPGINAIPQLPPTEPPLGIKPGSEKTLGR